MLSLDRRQLIAGVMTVAAPGMARAAAGPAMSTPANGRLNFNIIRQGKPFGQYALTFARSGDSVTVTTDAAMAFILAGIKTFDYHHHCVEVWQGGRFLELHSQSIRDGRVTDTVSALRGEFQTDVSTNKGNFVVPANASPLTHWNRNGLSGVLFNPQDGKRMEMIARNIGKDGFTLANNAPITADHWMLRGDQTVDEWYDDAGVWTGLRGVLTDKSVIEYHRV